MRTHALSFAFKGVKQRNEGIGSGWWWAIPVSKRKRKAIMRLTATPTPIPIAVPLVVPPSAAALGIPEVVNVVGDDDAVDDVVADPV
jgi:hypothetical protein